MEVLRVGSRLLGDAQSLGDRASAFTSHTPLVGAIPELDSIAVVSLITGLEDPFGLVLDDHDIDGATFGTVGSLCYFVSNKLTA